VIAAAVLLDVCTALRAGFGAHILYGLQRLLLFGDLGLVAAGPTMPPRARVQSQCESRQDGQIPCACLSQARKKSFFCQKDTSTLYPVVCLRSHAGHAHLLLAIWAGNLLATIRLARLGRLALAVLDRKVLCAFRVQAGYVVLAVAEMVVEQCGIPAICTVSIIVRAGTLALTCRGYPSGSSA